MGGQRRATAKVICAAYRVVVHACVVQSGKEVRPGCD